MEERRFQPPPGFEAWALSPPPGLHRGALAPPRAELWLIRAPPDFQPQSLEGCTVPLGGAGRLRGGYAAGGAPGGGGSARLLVPDAPGGPLVCAPPLCGAVAIRCDPGVPGIPGDPGAAPEPKAKRRKKRKEREKEPELPDVRTPVKGEPRWEWKRAPRPDSRPAPTDTEEASEVPEEAPEPPRKKKKKHKRKQEPVGMEVPPPMEEIPA